MPNNEYFFNNGPKVPEWVKWVTWLTGGAAAGNEIRKSWVVPNLPKNSSVPSKPQYVPYDPYRIYPHY